MKLNQAVEMQKNKFLTELCKILWLKRKNIIAANKKDLDQASKTGLSHALIQRLELNEADLKQSIKRLNSLQKMGSGIGENIESKSLDNGLILNKTRTPIGTIAIIYESRPEVTIDVVSLCVKSGNKAIMKGGSEAIYTNLVLMKCIQKALETAKINANSVKFIKNRDSFLKLIRSGENVDLVIARGSYELVKTITRVSKVPVLAHSAGGARIYIDQSADLQIAKKIILNSKLSKPAACNSLDTILIHKDIDKSLIKDLVDKLENSGIVVLDSGWEKEFLDLCLNIKIVKDVDEAVGFIEKYGKGHSEGIVAEDKEIIETFINNVDSAAVFVNCSTRFHDGFEFGMGAEMGIATGKLHARGPVGLKELTTYRWEVYGQGQIRN